MLKETLVLGIFIGDVLFFNGKRTALLNLWHYLRVWSSIVTRISGGGVCIRNVIFGQNGV
jgi:hypothetical protein